MVNQQLIYLLQNVIILLFYPAAKLVENLVFSQVCDQVFDKFVRVCDTLSTFFVENLVANLLHQSRHVEIDAADTQDYTRASSVMIVDQRRW